MPVIALPSSLQYTRRFVLPGCRWNDPVKASFFMRLSQHPLMSHRGHPTWPPEWSSLSGICSDPPDGEAGVLVKVKLSAVKTSAIFLTMSFNGGRYVSHLSFDDSNFCREICELLKHYYGWPIKKIGELNVP
jgi:hypothetical protein